MTIPNQGMSMRTIVDRFVKNLSVNAVQRDPVYIDQNEFDFEQLSRMDFGEKKAAAEELRARAEERKQQFVDNERAKEAKIRQDAEELEAHRAERRHSNSLDNTMPIDTDSDSQSVRRGKK